MSYDNTIGVFEGRQQYLEFDSADLTYAITELVHPSEPCRCATFANIGWIAAVFLVVCLFLTVWNSACANK